jgi:hypothetical protein
VVNLQSILGQDTKSVFVVDSKHDTHRCKNITKHGIHTHTHTKFIDMERTWDYQA